MSSVSSDSMQAVGGGGCPQGYWREMSLNFSFPIVPVPGQIKSLNIKPPGYCSGNAESYGDCFKFRI
ncbi:hypothetical protein CEXT_192601 [Caerostris extrusa]|uniref:Uncharacterized protein n=1 Tax=Caerostris extrusa TaxID=172846 RepID=A0AAV4V2V1_CAEEX|nr:hypothetical protein CEXT_192601 [Caerostris extrusa]